MTAAAAADQRGLRSVLRTATHQPFPQHRGLAPQRRERRVAPVAGFQALHHLVLPELIDRRNDACVSHG